MNEGRAMRGALCAFANRSGAGLVALVLALMATVACSDGGPDHASSSSATTGSSTTTTQPSASDDPESAFAAVEDVVNEATSLADKMYQDPAGTIDDPDQADLEHYRSLFTDGAETPAGVEAQLRNLAEAGQRLRASPVSGVYRETKVFGFRAVDPETVRFRVCSLRDQETVDAAGAVVSQVAEVVQGDGEARRESGVWLFYGVDPDDDGPLALTPGAVNSGFCDTVAATAGEPAS